MPNRQTEEEPEHSYSEDTAPFVTWCYIGLYNGTSLYKSERVETFDAFDFPLK